MAGAGPAASTRNASACRAPGEQPPPPRWRPRSAPNAAGESGDVPGSNANAPGLVTRAGATPPRGAGGFGLDERCAVDPRRLGPREQHAGSALAEPSRLASTGLGGAPGLHGTSTLEQLAQHARHASEVHVGAYAQRRTARSARTSARVVESSEPQGNGRADAAALTASRRRGSSAGRSSSATADAGIPSVRDHRAHLVERSARRAAMLRTDRAGARASRARSGGKSAGIAACCATSSATRASVSGRSRSRTNTTPPDRASRQSSARMSFGSGMW